MITTVITNLGPRRFLQYIPPNGKIMEQNESLRVAGVFDTLSFMSYNRDIYQQMVDDLAINWVQITTDLTGADITGVGGKLTKELKDVPLSPTVHGSFVDTGITLTELPNSGGWVGVFVNGVLYPLGDGVTSKAFYFSDDPLGLTAKTIENILVGDQLWANPTALGFSLDASDRASLLFSVS